MPGKPMIEIEKATADLRARLESRRGLDHAPLSPDPSHLSRPDSHCTPDCPLCGGLGVVRLDVPPQDFRFGKLFPCPNLPEETLHQEGRYGLFWDEQRRLSWGGVLDTNEVGEALRAVRAALERGHGWVYLWGGYGTAKTLLLKTAVAETLRLHRHAVYARMADLLDDLRTAYEEDHASTALVERMGHYTSLPLLALDEIERHNQTEWARERVFQLLDRRYAAAEAERSVTLIASNSPPERLDGYLGSRVRDGRFKVVEMKGADLRPGLGGS